MPGEIDWTRTDEWLVADVKQYLTQVKGWKVASAPPQFKLTHAWILYDPVTGGRDGYSGA